MERIQEAWPGLLWGLLWVRPQPASKPNQHCSHLSKERPQARARTETPWTLQAATAGATSGGRRRAGTTRLKSQSKKTRDERFQKPGRCGRRDHSSFCGGGARGGWDEQILARESVSEVRHFDIQPARTFFVSVKRASVSLSTSAGLRVQDLHLPWQGPFSSLLTKFDQVGSYIVKRSNCARLKLL